MPLHRTCCRAPGPRWGSRPGSRLRPSLLLVSLCMLLASWPPARAAAAATAEAPPPEVEAAAPCPPGVRCRKTFLPTHARASQTYQCPVTSTRQYAHIPFTGSPTDRPAALHADLNLALRGYVRVAAPLTLVDYYGSTDPGAPQMAGLYAPRPNRALVGTYQVYDWNWACGPNGCRGPLLSQFPVTLLGIQATPGEAISAPMRPVEIYGGGYVALVLYAEARRITLKYTREDNVVNGYTVHLENVCVDPNLLALYNYLNAAGRPSLPALHNGEPLGTAAVAEIDVAIRDRGNFMDPRSRKDWWR